MPDLAVWQRPAQSGSGFTPSQFGATPAVADARVAVGLAAAAAKAAGAPLTIDAMYNCPGGGIVFDGINVLTGGRGCGLKCTADPGNGNSFITITDTAGSNVPLKFTVPVFGPGAYSLGVKTCNGDGVTVTGNAKTLFEDGFSTGFRAGVVLNNALGHISFNHWTSTGNYYGAYCIQDTSDYFAIDSDFSGNNLAGWATPAAVGLSTLMMIRTHIGVQPFGFLQEAGLSGNLFTPFMSETVLDQLRFESIGNGAIVSLATFDVNDKINTGGLYLRDCGWSFWSGAHLGTMTDAYLIDLGLVNEYVEIWQSLLRPFAAGAAGQAGSSGVFRCQQGAGPGMNIRGSSIIPAGKLSVLTGALPIKQGPRIALETADTIFNSLIVQGSAGAAIAQMLNANGEIDFNSITNRIAYDAAGHYNDVNGVWRVRDSANGYATLMEVKSGMAGAIKGGAVATGGRPSAVTAGAGAHIFDTTIDKPIWSDGTTWRDASGDSNRTSFNAEAAAIAIPGTNTWTKVVETPIPKLRGAESGPSAVTDPLAGSFLARGKFQIVSITAPEPTQFIVELNFRNLSDDTIASNLGFWYVVLNGAGSIAALQFFDVEWPYVPYNNIPSAPFIEVGDGSAYSISLDLRLNNGAGGISIANGYVAIQAGSFYTPGTTQIGNSPAPGPIGNL